VQRRTACYDAVARQRVRRSGVGRTRNQRRPVRGISPESASGWSPSASKSLPTAARPLTL